MSANKEVVIRRKQNGLYEIRELQTEDGTIGENTLSIIGDDIDGLDEAIGKANAYLDEQEENGYPVEYRLRIIK